MKMLIKITSRSVMLALILACACATLPGEAQAAACNGNNTGALCMMDNNNIGICDAKGACGSVPYGTCTNDDAFNIAYPAPGQGIISGIVTQITSSLDMVQSAMYKGIIQDSGFKHVVTLAASLYVAIYGILFMFGMVSITVNDLVVRLIKIGIIAMLISPGSWAFFSQTMVHLFNDGTNDIINEVSSIALGTINVGGAPFAVVDNAVIESVSARAVITVLAAFTTGPYGWIIGLMLVISMGAFLKALMNAMWVYVMALVLRTLLFGLAPLFIPMILFGRTRHLFDGWLNQLVNSALQPIFLFTFFGFFCQLIKVCLDQIVSMQVCWTATEEVQRGSPSSFHYWRFAIRDASSGGWVPFDAVWGLKGANNAGSGPIHPLGIMLPLTMWLLSDLAGRFNHIVVEIARDIAGASTSLTMGGEKVADWLTGGGKGGGSTKDAVNKIAPGLGNRIGTGLKSSPGGKLDAGSKPVQQYAPGAGGRTGPGSGPGTGGGGGGFDPGNMV
jgi:type IV secretory pathway VirB6-like protein